MGTGLFVGANLSATERKIIGAYLDLYERQPSSRIKVTQVCERAGVSRVTFYSYFEGAEQLLSFVEQQTLADMREVFEDMEYLDVSAFLGASGADRPIPMFVRSYRYVREHARAYRALFGPYGRNSFVIAYERQVKDSIRCLNVLARLSPRERDDVATMCQGCVCQLSRAWIERGFDVDERSLALTCTRAFVAILGAWLELPSRR